MRAISVCDRIHPDGSSANGRNERQEEMLFSEVTWGTGGWKHPSIPVSSRNSCSDAHVGIKPDVYYGEEFPLWLKFS